MSEPAPASVEEQVAAWRTYLAARSELARNDVEELEDHLRSHITDLTAMGLDDDEAFLVGVKRMGAVHDISLEFAREYTSRLWKQLTMAPDPAKAGRNFRIALGLAVAAALIVQIQHSIAPNVLGRNLGLLVLPFLASYFAWTRRVGPRTWITIGAWFSVAAIAANVYPFVAGSDTEILIALHLPIVLWLIVGVAHAAGEWRSHEERMNFVRFTGEWFVYYVLIALGGGVLIGLMTAVFEAIGVAAEDFLIEWVLVSGAAGAVLIAAWLVDAKQTVIENIAPVLSQIFTPLFTLALLAFLLVTMFGGSLVDVDRTALIVFNLLLVVVLGLLVYTISARDPHRPARTADVVQFVLLASALIADLVVLLAIVSRIAEFGFSANKTAALGENLVLLGNLIWATFLAWGFLRRRRSFDEIERWQTAYLPIYAAWATIVVVGFPLVFGF